jgi:small-conductance mechanosensitive channel
VLGIVVGFAFRDIAENFLASLLLSIRRPFRAGEYIEVTGMGGTVLSMNTRSTVLLSSEGNHIQIPNAAIFKNTIVNYSASANRRDTLLVGVGYDISVARAQDIILEVVAGHEAVLSEPAPMILVDSLGSSTVNVIAYFWVDAQAYSLLKVKSALLRLVKKALTEEGITMPDDAREVIFPQGVPVLQLGGKAEERAQKLANEELEDTERASGSEVEPASTASEAEGDLKNEQDQIAEIAAGASVEEGETDLLSGKT